MVWYTIVCDVTALVRSYYPKLPAKEIKEIQLESSVKYDLEVQIPDKANGIVKQFKEPSKTGEVINAYNTLITAKEHCKKRE